MGYIYVLGAFVLIGSYLVPVRFARAKGDAFLALMGIGLLGCLVVLGPRLMELARHPAWLAAGVFSGVLWAVAQGFANRAVSEIPFAKAVVVFNLNTFVNIAAGILLFREAATAGSAFWLAAGGTVLFIGAVLVSGAQSFASAEGDRRKGIVLSALAGLIWGVYFIPLKYVQKLAPAPELGETHLLTGLLLGGGLGAVAIGARSLRLSGWRARDLAWGVASGIAWTVGTAFFLAAIRELGLSRAVPLINMNTLMYVGWSLFVFREIPLSQAWRVLAGALVAVLGAWLFTWT